MITENTVFILGAGASKPYGFPSAWGLRLDIINNFYKKLLGVFAVSGAPLSSYIDGAKKFINQFRDSRNTSIDLFLSRNPEFSYFGKDAIILDLLESEKISLDHWYRGDISSDWYISIFNYMLEGLTLPKDYLKFGDNKITFITFNYDRSLEHYLYTALLNSYSEAKPEEIKNIFDKINIYHVYGKLGDLFWQIGDGNSSETFLNYGRTDISYSVLEYFRNSIKTIPERIPLVQNGDIYNAIRKANQIFFLGFSFGDENMDILKEAIERIPQSTSIYSTVMGLSDKKIKSIWNKYFNQLFSGISQRSYWTSEGVDANALLIKHLL
jgi:hypothetical protein